MKQMRRGWRTLSISFFPHPKISTTFWVCVVFSSTSKGQSRRWLIFLLVSVDKDVDVVVRYDTDHWRLVRWYYGLFIEMTRKRWRVWRRRMTGSQNGTVWSSIVLHFSSSSSTCQIACHKFNHGIMGKRTVAGKLKCHVGTDRANFENDDAADEVITE